MDTKSETKYGQGLSPCDEELILSYLDGEAGFFSARRAKRILERSPSAQSFADSILALRSRIGEWHQIQLERSGKVDLWERIERRIDQEERAAVFLGGREFASRMRQPRVEGESIFSKIFGPWGWSATTAVVAASLTFVLVQPVEKTNPSLSLGPSTTPRLLDEPLPGMGVRDVSFIDNSDQYHRDQMKQIYRRAKVRESLRGESNSQIVPSEMNQLTQVDWMRSDGQLYFVQQPRPGSTIIWVKRPKPAQNAGALAPRADRPVVFGENEVFPIPSSRRK